MSTEIEKELKTALKISFGSAIPASQGDSENRFFLEDLDFSVMREYGSSGGIDDLDIGSINLALKGPVSEIEKFTDACQALVLYQNIEIITHDIDDPKKIRRKFMMDAFITGVMMHEVEGQTYSGVGCSLTVFPIRMSMEAYTAKGSSLGVLDMDFGKDELPKKLVSSDKVIKCA